MLLSIHSSHFISKCDSISVSVVEQKWNIWCCGWEEPGIIASKNSMSYCDSLHQLLWPFTKKITDSLKVCLVLGRDMMQPLLRDNCVAFHAECAGKSSNLTYLQLQATQVTFWFLLHTKCLQLCGLDVGLMLPWWLPCTDQISIPAFQHSLIRYRIGAWQVIEWK